MSVKMNTAHFIAKELQFTKFPGLLQLQQKNGIQMTNTYSNDKKCAKHKIPLCLFCGLNQLLFEHYFQLLLLY